MFAPLVAKAKTSTVGSTTGKPGPQHSTLAARLSAGSAVEQASMLRPSVGNQAVLRLLGKIQPKLEVGRIDDPLEHEADRVADQVMRTSDRDLSATEAARQPEQKCDACEEAEKSRTIQAKQTAAGQPADSVAPGIVPRVLGSPGTPLDAASRAFFEPRFGRNFGAVRVHTDSEAARSAQAINARAYTLDQHIVFGNQQFAPRAPRGKLLLAHELAHVVQQGGARRVRRDDAPVVDWRDQARNKVPYNQWTVTQKETAEQERHAANRRLFEGDGSKIDFTTYDSDNELFKLQHPYEADMRAFQELRTVMQLDLSANWVSDFHYESEAGKRVTLTARVDLPGKRTPAVLDGDVLFEIFTDLRQVDLQRQHLTGPCTPAASNPCGKATYVTVALPKGKYRVKASYQPLNTGNRPSSTERFLDVIVK